MTTTTTTARRNTRRAVRTNEPGAAVYLRISNDRVGAGLGVDRQERDCRDLAARLGVPVTAVYTDNDVSAYQRRKVRNGYQAMLDDMAAGKFGHVLAWHTDRL